MLLLTIVGEQMFLFCRYLQCLVSMDSKKREQGEQAGQGGLTFYRDEQGGFNIRLEGWGLISWGGLIS